VPAAHPGAGSGLLEATREQGLEGVVAKRLDSRYEPGRRPGSWLKVKNTLRQELVIGGWLSGEGRREKRIGALLMGYFDNDELVYAGRVGTGFSEKTLDEMAKLLEPLRRERSPFTAGPRLPREAVFVEPRLVAEIEFREWTTEGVMRAPSFKGLREDKPAEEVTRDGDASAEASRRGSPGSPGSRVSSGSEAVAADAGSPEALFDEVERLPEGVLSVVVDGRQLRISNWDKLLFPRAGLTKGDLIAYYTRIAPAVVPHLRDRPLTLKRYPNGVEEPYFYEKQSPSHRPEWVQTARVGDIEYTLTQDRPTLVWLANLADVELHTSLSLVPAIERPTMVVFDLDPGAPAGLVECCEVGLVLHGLFDQLGLESFAKTSGSKGLQVYVPLNIALTYEQTKPLAKRIAELLEQRMPELVVSRMTKRLRPGRVLVDWSQNDIHKTTVNVYSVRARERPTVSTPVSWEEVGRCREEGDEGVLTFEVDDVLARAGSQGDLFAPVLSVKQDLPALG
jgi:bifunctional non-homologous end joining protein LigD